MVQMVDAIAERTQGLVLLLGRLGVGALFLPSGLHKLSNISGTAAYLGGLGVYGPPTVWAWLVGLIELLGGLAILVGFQTRLAALVLCIFTIIAAYLGHPYWAADEAHQTQQYINFWKDIAIAAGLLFLFARGAGAISIDRR